jgi:MFS family permease
LSGNSPSHPPEYPGQPAEKIEKVGFWPVLRNPNFLALWSGQVFSQLADKVYLVLMISLISDRFQVADQTISGWVSAIMIAFTIPAIFLGSLAGVYVDRHPKRQILISSNLLRGGLVLTIPPLLLLSQGMAPVAGLPLGFCLLLVITFLVSSLTQFFAPAEQATIPLLVKNRYLLSANSLYTTTMMAATIVGFAIGEPLLNWADRLILHTTGLASGKALLVGGSYGVAGLLLLLMRVQESVASGPGEDQHFWLDLKEGLAYLRNHRGVRDALVQLVVLFSVFAALAVLAVRLAEVIPQLEADQFGWLLSVGSVGMGLGALVVGQFGQGLSRTRLAKIGTIGMGTALLGLALWHETLTPTLIAIGILGLFAAFVGIPMQTAIQEQTPETMRGKVFGLQNNAVNIALSLPLALAGIAESLWGLGVTLTGLAIALALGGIPLWIRSEAKNPGE